MSYRYERHDEYDDYYYEERPRRRRTCLIVATILVWALVFACIGFYFFGQRVVTDFVNRRIARVIDPDIAPNVEPLDALRDSLASIPSVEIPPGEYVVSEEQADDYLDTSRPAGFDDMQVRFVPGEVVTDITWNGFTGTARMGVEARDGRLVAVNPRLDPPLGAFLSIDAVVGVLEERLNNELVGQGRRVTSVEIEAGQARLMIE